MGLLDAGTPMEWEEARQHRETVKRGGVEQFINIYTHYKHEASTPFLWGDEIEMFVVELDAHKRTSRLSMRAPAILAELKTDIEDPHGATWHPEYANWMIEGTPATPYCKASSSLVQVERNMSQRRQEVRKLLKDDEEVLSLPVFPRLGASGFTADGLVPTPEGTVSQSLYIPDESIQQHPRFPTLTANIRKRRGEKVMIAVPVFIDNNTADALAKQNAEILKTDRVHGREIVEQLGDSIYMDAMAFGMGANCLQVTFQASDVQQARTLYDQLAVMAPIMLALTAGSPIWKGMLADTDTRWNIISASVDDRTPQERGLSPATPATAEPCLQDQDDKLVQRIYKSRYSSIDCFIGESDLNRAEFSDVPVPLDARALARLSEAAIDERLARHVASLFVRDPLVIYHEKLLQDDSVVWFFLSQHVKLPSPTLSLSISVSLL
jgi:glutamate--cysteine ligase catalytic subunit